MRTILLSAIHKKNTKLVMSLLEKFPLYILLSADSEGRTIAHYLAGEGMLEGLRYLANNPSTQILLTTADKNHCTPFIMAVLGNQKIIINYFIENQYDDFASDTHEAAFFGRLEKIKNLDKNGLEKKDTFNIDPLGYAVAAGQTEVVQFLIENHFQQGYANYSSLFILAVDKEHYAIIPLLLKKMHCSDFIKKIPKLMKILANNYTNAIETLNILAIDQLVFPQNSISCYSLFMIEAIINNTSKMFAYFIEHFFKEKPHLFVPDEIKSICSLIYQYRRFHFIAIVAKEIHSLSRGLQDVAARFCCYFTETDDGISLDFFLKAFNEFGADAIDQLKYCDDKYNLFYNTIKNHNLDLMPILRRYFGDAYFLEYSSLFATKKDFTDFIEAYLPAQYSASMIYSFEYSEFIRVVYRIISMPKSTIEDYEMVSKSLYICCKVPPAYAMPFAGITIDSLCDILEVYVKTEQFDWPLLKKIFSDIKYLALGFTLPIQAEHLNAFLKLSFIFSDYQAANDAVNKLLANQENLLSIHIMNFLIAKLCALFFLELNFFPSNKTKEILLYEYVSTDRGSSSFIGGTSLLTLLPKIKLTPKISKNLCKRLEKITPESINKKINIDQLTILPNVTKSIFQSIQILYHTLYGLKEWIDNIDIDSENTIGIKDDRELLQRDLTTLRSYKNCYSVKILFLQAIVELVKALNKFEKSTLITLLNEKEYPGFQKELENIFAQLNKNHTTVEFYEISLHRAKDDLAQLLAACLITEEHIKEAAQRTTTIVEKKDTPEEIVKKLEKPTQTIKATKKPSNPAKTPCPIPVVKEKSGYHSTPWNSGKNKKGHPVLHNGGIFCQPPPPKKKIPPQPSTKKIVPISTSPRTEPIHFGSNYSIPRNWEALKNFLYDKHRGSLKILANSKLLEWGFSIHIPSIVKNFFSCFQPNQLFLVGGAIRNSLRRVSINDFDFVVFLSAEKIKQKFLDYKTQGKGRKTTLIVYHDGYAFDLLPIENTSYQDTLLRDKLEYETVLALLRSDYWQRDFTINALYWNPYMGIVDFCGGMRDLLFNRTIVPIQSKSKHFEMQDAVHILRAVRFAAQFQLNIKKDLYLLMMANIPFLYTVHLNKLIKEYQSLLAVFGETQANQIYHHYHLHDLLSKRMPLSMPTWGSFWRSDAKPSAPAISKRIENYLPERDLRALRCVSKLFNPVKMRRVAVRQQSTYLKNQV